MKPAALLALLALLLLSGCAREEVATQARAAEQQSNEQRADTPYLYRDSATGCEYLNSYYSAALTPRIDSDGKSHRGCKTPLLEK